jgi:Mrp family chromosome partitioning ATPase
MENIRQALERSRELGAKRTEPKDRAPAYQQPPVIEPRTGDQNRPVDHGPEFTLNAAHLETNRIIAHDENDPRSRSFDMLRTQVLQSMDQKNWKILGVTSPTPGCGKTVTAINLALSISRQPDRSVLLVDLDLQKPQHIAIGMGLNCKTGVFGVLEGHTSLSNAIIPTRASNCQVMVLPTEKSTSDSSAWMVSREMSAMLQEIKRDYRSHIIVIDLPPMLASDDVIALMPQLDCVLLVAAVGKSTVLEIEECNTHLQSAEVVRLVLNKVPELNVQYYAYNSSRPSRK